MSWSGFHHKAMGASDGWSEMPLLFVLFAHGPCAFFQEQ